MSFYINTESNEYPVYLSDIKNQYPYTSFPSELADFHPYYVVHEQPFPQVDQYHKVIEIFPIIENGIWIQQYSVVALSEEELSSMVKARAIPLRARRNQLLSQSDWTQVLDAPVDKAAWATYRQALRDVTQQTGFPLEVTWPQQPQ
jgi:hypothetical protein